MMWLVFLYMISDALIELYGLIAESATWILAGAEKPLLPTLARLAGMIETYGAVVLINGGLLILWALYNQARFRGHDRHRSRNPVNVDDLAARYARPVEDIVQWQQADILMMHHGPDGNLTEVVTKTRPARMAAEPAPE